MTAFRFQCSCGRTAHEGRGRPLATVACYCNDCRAAARAIDALPGGRGGLAADGGIAPDMCVFTKYAPQQDHIAHRAPRYAALPPKLIAKVLGAQLALALSQLPLVRA